MKTKRRELVEAVPRHEIDLRKGTSEQFRNPHPPNRGSVVIGIEDGSLVVDLESLSVVPQFGIA